jgi:dihydroflavonol-4-reductase
MNKKVLVTGASGFVGSVVARLLIDRGYEVRTLVRSTSSLDNLKGLNAEIVFGDLRDVNSLEIALKDCEYLFHVAADYRLWSLNPQELYDNNVTGTKNIMRAALKADVKKIVYTSSVATLGLHSDSSPSNENTKVSFNDMIGDYKKSKYLAEEVVKKMTIEEGLPATIVNPSTPVGPGDIKPTPTGKLILDAAAGKIPAFVDTGLNWVHVDDVAMGHLLALEKGKLGERYILGNENFSMKVLLEKIASITGKPAPKIQLPHNLVLPIAYVVEWWANISKSKNEPMATVSGVKLSKKKMYFSVDKAKTELGYNPKDVMIALNDAIDWYKKNDYLS